MRRQKCNIKGFTLLELLIVVLIIGILAAVAVPQYQKAVLKSRFSSLMPLTRSIANSNEVYYMTHNRYADDPSVLDIAGQAQLPEGTGLTLQAADFAYVKAERADLPACKYIVYQKHSKQFADNIHCEALKEHALANWLCGTALKGIPIAGSIDGAAYQTYILQGSETDGHYPLVYEDENRVTLTELDKCVSVAGGCRYVTATAGSVCEADESARYGCVALRSEGATCIGNAESSCQTNSTSGSAEAGFYKDNSLCVGNGHDACAYSNYDHSTCIGTGEAACSGGGDYHTSTFSNNSLCQGEGKGACVNATFTDSTCIGTNAFACNSSTYDNSACYGANGGCASSTFSNGSKCYMTGPTACYLNTYNDTSCCVSDRENGYICPDHECP